MIIRSTLICTLLLSLAGCGMQQDPAADSAGENMDTSQNADGEQSGSHSQTGEGGQSTGAGSDNGQSGNGNNGESDNTSGQTDMPNMYDIPGPVYVSAIQPVTLSQGSQSVSVQWIQASAPNGAYYRVWLGDTAQTTLTRFDATKLQSHVLTMTKAGTYSVKVEVCSDPEGQWCRFSNVQRFDVLAEDTSAYQVEGQPILSGIDGDYCLAVDDQQVSVEACNGSRSQAFLVGGPTVHWAQDTRLCLGVDSETQGSVVKLMSCQTAPSWSYQNHLFQIGSLALDVNQANRQVIVWGQHGNANQKWYVGEKPVSGGNEPAEFDGAWTSVAVELGENYGTHRFQVPAAQNWVNTGLFLRRGQQARIQANGEWAVKNTNAYGPEGHPSNSSRGCAEGQLVARLGLYYKDPAISCIGSSATFTAHEDGILYVGAVVSNDLGETYEARKDARGVLDVQITSTGETVPTLSPIEASTLDWSLVTSGWIEVRGDHTILTLPVSTAQQDAGKLVAAVKRLDDIYLQHESLRGKRPYHGQPVRWFPDTKDAPGWMLAGNPVRMDPALVAANGDSRITLAAEPGNNDWGFAHELGHNFNFAGGDWYYTTFGGLEAWPNIFTLYAIEQLALPPREMQNCAVKKQEYLNKNVHENSLGGAWNGLCFLSEFTERYGWSIWKNFYQDFNALGGSGWTFLRDRLNDASGDDTTDIFQSWNIPL